MIRGATEAGGPNVADCAIGESGAITGRPFDGPGSVDLRVVRTCGGLCACVCAANSEMGKPDALD
jgi:hypothetical protein